MSHSIPSAAWSFALSQVGWFACVLGAAHGWLWAGPLVVGFLAVLFVVRSGRPGRALLRLMAVAGFGLVTDSVLMACGALHFPDAVQMQPDLLGPPLWMLALWVGFGTTLDGVLHALRTRLITAALVGAIFGPMGYRAGVALGAAELGSPSTWSLACVAVAWAAALPSLLRVDAALEGSTIHPSEPT